MKKQFSEEILNSFKPSEPRKPDKLKEKVMASVEGELAAKPKRIFFLGRGFVYGIASVFVVLLTASLMMPSLLQSRSAMRSNQAEKDVKTVEDVIAMVILSDQLRSFSSPIPTVGYIGLLGVPGDHTEPGDYRCGRMKQGIVYPDNWEEINSLNPDATVTPPKTPDPEQPTEDEYGKFVENPFAKAMEHPFSTFSIDVDTASYSIIRRYITSGQKPPSEAVRIEEMINYFKYEYATPGDGLPFSVNTEFGPCPWNPKNCLILVGLQGRNVDMSLVPPSNLVFLLDVSGSMSSADKLPLLKEAFKILVERLRPQDRVAIVVYAGAAGLVLPSTSGSDKARIIAALDSLQSGGSTAGGAGIVQAYSVAAQNFIKGGNNRVILATDGDFNVGVSSDEELVKLIEEKRTQGVFLSVLGFGLGNLKDSKMEKLADNGNGNYAYIDTIEEAERVFGRELSGTIFTIAKDVKLQIEFNPAKISKYRLIGYENRILRKEDFDNDAKDAGELGSGHCVTALYEVVLATGAETELVRSKYTETKLSKEAIESDDLMTVNLRYKNPDEDVSKLIVQTVLCDELAMNDMSSNFRFAAAVTEFGLILRDSAYKANANANSALSIAQSALNFDPDSYRKEFTELVRKYLQIQ